MADRFPNCQSIEKFLKEQIGTLVAIRSTDIYLYIHYLDKSGEMKKYQMKYYNLDNLTEESFADFINLNTGNFKSSETAQLTV